MIWVVIIVLYILSKTDTAFKNVFNWIAMFLAIVFIVLSFGFVTDSVKKWLKD